MGVAKRGQIKVLGKTNGFNGFPILTNIGIEPLFAIRVQIQNFVLFMSKFPTLHNGRGKKGQIKVLVYNKWLQSISHPKKWE